MSSPNSTEGCDWSLALGLVGSRTLPAVGLPLFVQSADADSLTPPHRDVLLHQAGQHTCRGGGGGETKGERDEKEDGREGQRDIKQLEGGERKREGEWERRDGEAISNERMKNGMRDGGREIEKQ